MSSPAPRVYEAQARSSDTFGRVLASARNHHYVVDGPVHNGCPGEAVTPSEVFLSGVACCGVELIQVIARDQQVPLRSVHTTIVGTMDPAHPVRPDVTLFNRVDITFTLGGVSQEQAETLVGAFKKR